jgi:uncharacterized Zn finger protein (UPF0148 family)
MTTVRGVTQAYRDYWINLIGSEVVPVKPGVRLDLMDRILGRKHKAYYLLDINALDSFTRSELVGKIANKYNISESAAKKMVLNMKIPARMVEKAEPDSDTCPVCGRVLVEKKAFCPYCGSRLRGAREVEDLGSNMHVLVENTARNEEHASGEGGLQTVQVAEEPVQAVETDIAVELNDFRITWSRVLVFLEGMHKEFDLQQVKFDEDGKAVPVFSSKTRRRKGL